MARGPSMRLLLLDPGLLNRHGHHFHTDLAIYDECVARHIAITVLGNRRVEPEIQRALPVEPVFRAPAYPSRDGAGARSLLRDFDVLNRLVEHDLRRTRAGLALDGDDLIVIPTARDIHLSGMLRWYETLSEPRPGVHIRLLFDPGFRVTREEVSQAARLGRDQLRRWAAVGGDRVVFLAERARLASYYGDLLDTPVRVMPMIVRYPPTEAPPTPRPGGRHVVFVGEARREKGFGLLPVVCRRLLETHPSTRFTIQVSCLFDIDRSQVQELAGFGPAVRLVTSPMSAEEYYALLQSADLVLLPYDPDCYRFRTSLIFLEALGLGRVVVTTRATWMHEQLERYGASQMAAESFTAEAVVATIERLFACWAESRSMAERAGRAVRSQHDASAFMDALLCETRRVVPGGRG